MRREVLHALGEFKQEFFAPSAARRRELLERYARGELAQAELPRDVLAVLLQDQERLGVADELLPREVALFMVGAHTAANQITHLVHQVWAWAHEHPEDARKPHEDLRFLQRAMQESVRLNPPTPVLLRQAPDEPVTLRTGTRIPAHAIVEVVLDRANRDVSVFGAEAEQFNPYRRVPSDVYPWGLSFGAGSHTCIGQEMAIGQPVADPTRPADEHLFGVVPRAVRALFDLGMMPDPDRPPSHATHTSRREWGAYPVVFAHGGRADR